MTADAETVLSALRDGATLIKFEEPYAGIWVCYPFTTEGPAIMCKAEIVDRLLEGKLLERSLNPDGYRLRSGQLSD